MGDIRSWGIALYFIGWGVTVLVTLFYGLFAAWYKESSGRYIFSLLLSLSAVLTNTALRLIWPGQEWTRITGLVLFVGYIIAMLAMGVGMFNATIKKYLADEEAYEKRIKEQP